jgi:hypothetical protein
VKFVPNFDGKAEEKDCLEKLDGATLEGNIKMDLKK